jgi:hypothetical protein
MPTQDAEEVPGGKFTDDVSWMAGRTLDDLRDECKEDLVKESASWMSKGNGLTTIKRKLKGVRGREGQVDGPKLFKDAGQRNIYPRGGI